MKITGISDRTEMVMITDVERILSMDTSLRHLNQRVDLVLRASETSPESDFCKFEFGASRERFQWPSRI